MMRSDILPKKILLVEDDDGIAELIQTVLETSGNHVIICKDGERAQKLVFDDRPDLILLDLWIPGIDGQKLTTMLKGSELTRQIPIILVSAKSNIAEVSKQTKADGFLAKPFDLDDLRTIVQKHLD